MLCLRGLDMWGYGMAGGVGVRVVTGVNQIHGACRGDQGLFAVFTSGVSRRVYLGLFRTLVP